LGDSFDVATAARAAISFSFREPFGGASQTLPGRGVLARPGARARPYSIIASDDEESEAPSFRFGYGDTLGRSAEALPATPPREQVGVYLIGCGPYAICLCSIWMLWARATTPAPTMLPQWTADASALGRVGNVVRRQPSGLLRSAQTIDRLLRFREARARLLAVQLDGFDDTSLLYELEQVRVRCERRGLSALR
jgi:hypothetical protein